MRRKRYSGKLEVFEEEMSFIKVQAKTFAVEDDVTRRALLYALEVCVDVVMDMVAMATKDLWLRMITRTSKAEEREGADEERSGVDKKVQRPEEHHCS